MVIELVRDGKLSLEAAAKLNITQAQLMEKIGNQGCKFQRNHMETAATKLNVTAVQLLMTFIEELFLAILIRYH